MEVIQHELFNEPQHWGLLIVLCEYPVSESKTIWNVKSSLRAEPWRSYLIATDNDNWKMAIDEAVLDLNEEDECVDDILSADCIADTEYGKYFKKKLLEIQEENQNERS